MTKSKEEVVSFFDRQFLALSDGGRVILYSLLDDLAQTTDEDARKELISIMGRDLYTQQCTILKEEIRELREDKATINKTNDQIMSELELLVYNTFSPFLLDYEKNKQELTSCTQRLYLRPNQLASNILVIGQIQLFINEYIEDLIVYRECKK